MQKHPFCLSGFWLPYISIIFYVVIKDTDCRCFIKSSLYPTDQLTILSMVIVSERAVIQEAASCFLLSNNSFKDMLAFDCSFLH